MRAAVYDPLVQALDFYVGWQDIQAPGAASVADISAGNITASRTSRTDQKRRGKHKQRGSRRRAHVLVPGAGLGRLSAELAARGYASVHANEISPTSWVKHLARFRGFWFTVSRPLSQKTFFAPLGQGEKRR